MVFTLECVIFTLNETSVNSVLTGSAVLRSPWFSGQWITRRVLPAAAETASEWLGRLRFMVLVRLIVFRFLMNREHPFVSRLFPTRIH